MFLILFSDHSWITSLTSDGSSQLPMRSALARPYQEVTSWNWWYYRILLEDSRLIRLRSLLGSMIDLENSGQVETQLSWSCWTPLNKPRAAGQWTSGLKSCPWHLSFSFLCARLRVSKRLERSASKTLKNAGVGDSCQMCMMCSLVLQAKRSSSILHLTCQKSIHPWWY